MDKRKTASRDTIDETFESLTPFEAEETPQIEHFQVPTPVGTPGSSKKKLSALTSPFKRSFYRSSGKKVKSEDEKSEGVNESKKKKKKSSARVKAGALVRRLSTLGKKEPSTSQSNPDGNPEHSGQSGDDDSEYGSVEDVEVSTSSSKTDNPPPINESPPQQTLTTTDQLIEDITSVATSHPVSTLPFAISTWKPKKKTPEIEKPIEVIGPRDSFKKRIQVIAPEEEEDIVESPGQSTPSEESPVTKLSRIFKLAQQQLSVVADQDGLVKMGSETQSPLNSPGGKNEEFSKETTANVTQELQKEGSEIIANGVLSSPKPKSEEIQSKTDELVKSDNETTDKVDHPLKDPEENKAEGEEKKEEQEDKIEQQEDKIEQQEDKIEKQEETNKELVTSTSSQPASILPERREHLYKILVIGELGTGKTSVIKRYVHQFFSQHYRATIGVDFALKVLNWDNNTTVRLQLWDIAGQERFGNMTRVYYKEAVGAFIVFDVSRAATFDAVIKWKQDLDSKVQLPDGSPVPCVLLANKCDQQKEGIVNNEQKMKEYCIEKGFSAWFETSAKENINIEEAAKALVRKILINDKLIQSDAVKDDGRLVLDRLPDTQSSKKKCSC